MYVAERTDYCCYTENSPCFNRGKQAMRERREHPEMSEPEQEASEWDTNE